MAKAILICGKTAAEQLQVRKRVRIKNCAILSENANVYFINDRLATSSVHFLKYRQRGNGRMGKVIGICP